MSKLITLICFLCFAFFGFGQGEANIWYFGQNAGLDFNSGVPVALEDSAMFTNEGCASIADPNGNLLFYTDGITVFNRNHQIMANGTGLLGDFSATQSGVIVPQPDSDRFYFIFTVDDQGAVNGVHYNLVDMEADGGLGEVIVKNVQLVTPTTEKVTAVLHENNQDIWVLTYTREENAVYAYLVTSAGVDETPVVSPVSPTLADPFSNISYIGYMKASPNGEYLAMAHFSSTNSTSKVSVYELDAGTGIINNEVILEGFNQDAYGVEFSPSSDLLYVSDVSVNMNFITQFDLSVFNFNAINDSRQQIAQTDSSGPVFLGSLQLGPDGKIYVANTTRNFLSVINFPDELGFACDFEAEVIDLGTGISLFGLPTFIQSYFNIQFDFQNICFGDATEFILNNTNVASVTWDFGDPASGTNNTSTEFNPTHVFTSPGTYTVTLNATDLDGGMDDIQVEVEIFALPTPNENVSELICADAAIIPVDLTQFDNLISDDISNETISYYESETDANTATNPLSSPHEMGTETLFARVVNNESDCFSVVSLDVEVNSLTSEDTFLEVCRFDTEPLVFTLTDANNEINADPDVTISYHETLEDANLGIADLPNNYGGSGIVYARVTNANGCYVISELELIEHIRPDISSLGDIFCSSTDSTIISLSDYEEQLPMVAGVSFTFHRLEQEAMDNENALPDRIQVQNEETIYIRAEGTGGCFSLSDLTITVETLPSVGENAIDILPRINDNPIEGEVLLSDYNGWFNLASNQNLQYFATESDARLNINSLNEGETFTISFPTVIWVRVTNSSGNCFEIRELSLEIYTGNDNPCVPGIPTAFTPNSDGKNDLFSFLTPTLSDCTISISKVIIHDRWGNEVYNGTENWDGLASGSMIQGLYIFQVTFSSTGNFGPVEEVTRIGAVMLLN